MGHLELVRVLLEKWADTEAKDHHGHTALHWASQKGHLEVVRLLLKKGANIEAENEAGQTPLNIAEDDATREVLRQHKAKTKRLGDAIRRGDVGAVRTLLSGSAGSVAGFINGGDKYGITALHKVSKEGHIELVRLLLEKGADIQDQTRVGAVRAVLVYGFGD
ncbi:ankyrin repeat-containing domain protein [Ochromonadaceae sp. CCMP2298]|nr:ankyrin repeat-containing domain protein [Ochromonadaceae sp. CCMP2298]